MEGLSVLQELPDPLGSMLFQRVRDVELWAGIAPEERTALFAAETRGEPVAALSFRTMPEPGLREPLAVLEALVRDSGSADPVRVADACVRIAEWASERGHSATELAFAEAATHVRPEEAHLCFVAGRAARRQARYVRTQQWFERCIGLARRVEDWGAYTEAFLGWGIMESRRGRREEARTRFERAWRSAKRGGHRELQAAARHNLAVLLGEFGDHNEAERHAIAALRLYGPSHPRVPSLANDIATLWAQQSFFSTAYRVYKAVLPRLSSPKERLVLQANIARSAAAAGKKDTFLRTWSEITSHLDLAGEFAPGILRMGSEGALVLTYVRLAVDLARRAIEESKGYGDMETRIQAESILAMVAEGQLGRTDKRAPLRTTRLARRLTRLLRMTAPDS